jgi:oxygen-independent coproporphyrinogen-3 oxidase
MGAGLYVHFPFCRSRCSYCDFYSTTKGREEIAVYIELLKQEALLWENRFRQFPAKKEKPSDAAFFQERAPVLKNGKIEIDTIYFGGGTPSLLSGQQIQELLNHFQRIFHFSPQMEISMEANPDSILPNFLPEYQDAGINRISVGIQSMNDNELDILQRRSREIQNASALELLRGCFSNLSADLMIGIPAQTSQSLNRTLEHPALQDLPHISCYMLCVPEKSRLKRQIDRSTVILPTETATVAMYRKTIAVLKQKKLLHYEISNFARPGFESAHNLKYWQNTPYIGLGPTAGGYTGQTRYLNQPSLSRWKLQVEGKKNYFFLKKYQVKDAILEDIMLQFRLLKGISCKRINLWAQNYPRLGIHERIERLVRNKWLKFFRNHIMLTKKGLLFANEVFKEFLD